MSNRRRQTVPRAKSAPRPKLSGSAKIAADYDNQMFNARLGMAYARALAGDPIVDPEWDVILMRAQQQMNASHWRRTLEPEIERQKTLTDYLAPFETWEQAAGRVAA